MIHVENQRIAVTGRRLLEAWTFAALLFLIIVNSGMPGEFIYFPF